MSGPFAPPALPGFIATLDPSAPAPRIGTRLLGRLEAIDYRLEALFQPQRRRADPS